MNEQIVDTLMADLFQVSLRPEGLRAGHGNSSEASGAQDEASGIKRAVSLLVERTEELSRQGSPLVVRTSGEAYYMHPMRIARILLENRMDASTIQAGVLHSAYDIGITEDDVRSELGEDTAHLVAGVSSIQDLSLRARCNTLQQADSVRKMLFAMVDDVRIILIKMADRLDRVRNIRGMERHRQKEVAQEVIDIWAPLADRLGMQAEKNEFEDLSLKYSNPDVFQQIKAIVSQKKEERDAYLENAVSKIQQKANEALIKCVIKSRAKHFYSIYQKMRKRGKEASELFDLFAVRIICQKTSECYTLLGIVHGLWKPLDGRFKDYIAMPKANGYRSLHTTVMCDAADDTGVKRPLEIQIRTEEMDALAEHGVASHWLYKKGTNHDLVDISSLAIFNELRQWRGESTGQETMRAVFDRLKRDLLGDEIYVFTPKGEVVQLPVGSCAVDFAYRIHSSIGQTAVGAKADGKIIPLLQPLKNTQIIEVLIDPRAHPTEAWLKACATSKARQKIHAWLVANGIMQADDKKDTRAKDSFDTSKKEKMAGMEQGKGQKTASLPPRANIKRDAAPAAAGDVVIEGEDNFLHCLAKCCHPREGDAIAGFVSRSRGIVIHRASCLVYQRIPNKENRTVKVEWRAKR